MLLSPSIRRMITSQARCCSVRSRRPASSWSVAFNPDTLYATDERMRRQCVHRALEERKGLGFKQHGACNIEIRGGFHYHKGEDKSRERVMVAYLDGQDRVLRHEKADGSVWDRIHVYKDRGVNTSDGERPARIWAEEEESAKK